MILPPATSITDISIALSPCYHFVMEGPVSYCDFPDGPLKVDNDIVGLGVSKAFKSRKGVGLRLTEVNAEHSGLLLHCVHLHIHGCFRLSV